MKEKSKNVVRPNATYFLLFPLSNKDNIEPKIDFKLKCSTNSLIRISMAPYIDKNETFFLLKIHKTQDKIGVLLAANNPPSILTNSLHILSSHGWYIGMYSILSCF